MKPRGWDLSCPGGVRVTELWCLPAVEALLSAARPPHAVAEASCRRFDRKGQRVMNLPAPGSFFKCSHKSLFVLKS